MSIYRLYVQKKDAFSQEKDRLFSVFTNELHLPITNLSIFERYDVEGITPQEFESAKTLIFSEPPVDTISTSLSIPPNARVIVRQYLPGQYDQRADSAEQCLSMLTLKTGATVQTAQVLVVEGYLSEKQLQAITSYYINPVDSKEGNLDKPDTLQLITTPPEPVAIIEEFTEFTMAQLDTWRQKLGLAMTLGDLQFIQAYFKGEEKRNPTITEIRVLDTYWSDHCRHTTFTTELTEVTIDDDVYTLPIQKAYKEYLTGRQQLYTAKQKPMTLMDMATLAVKELRAQGKLSNLDESDEINACTIIVPVEVDGKTEEWLLLFKNETHNHPTEIEPFGGAATCLGGCIRDPLSGRAYVYQAMRVTGSGDPRTPLNETMKGKLPQSKITREAAKGYSSYGNQIGLATGEVHEYYHPGYVAKRMEIGAVIGAAPRFAVRREEPLAGDIIILLGGKTGRDGCGGATGSSKEHTITSLETCGAEVQKGNPITERKIQRLFRRPEVTTLIKRCNDFGAGGVSVAIGELTDGLDIDLDKVPKKYHGLDGTELAISESQERMACVIALEGWDRFRSYCDEENVDATIVATVTQSPRLVMHWQGQTIVDLSRAFLNTNGVRQQQSARITVPTASHKELWTPAFTDSSLTSWQTHLRSLAVTSQQGLAERFDSTIGNQTVLMPFGGKYQKTPVQGMVAKLPVLSGETTTTSIMTHGFNPQIASWSPFHGAQFAILSAIAKLVALGGKRQEAYLTLQEYFQRLTNENSWGLPTAALLGAYTAQKELEIGAIGGKDSMSGTFMDLTVPPTLVAFAVTTAPIDQIISPEWKDKNHELRLLYTPINSDGTPDWPTFKAHSDVLHQWILDSKVHSAYALGVGGLAEATSKMAFGNRIGASLNVEDAIRLTGLTETQLLFAPLYGSYLIEVDKDSLDYADSISIGQTKSIATIEMGDEVLPLSDLLHSYEATLDPIFPRRAKSSAGEAVVYLHDQHSVPQDHQAGRQLAQPTVLIPVFPGTNCEYDSARAFEKAGAKADIFIIRNRTVAQLEESIQTLRHKMQQAQILMFPGGFSAGDEPDGSGKFMSTLFRNPYLQEELENLLYQRDGLVLGICNGFQALIKLGLLPTGHVEALTETSPTLTYNTIGRHLSGMVQTKVISTKSPWMSLANAGEIYTVPISHGEGRFMASPAQIVKFNQKGQIATQYVDFTGMATYDSEFNPNQSVSAIEGLFSPDGRVFGKMAHIERTGYGIAKNIPGEKEMPVFQSGVNYFK